MPLSPQIYSPSIFSRKNVQSIFLSAILIGLTAANNSSSLRSKLFALIRFGKPSPALGVTIGPLTNTSQALISGRMSAGRLSIFATRFSIVMPSMVLTSILFSSISSLTSSLRTRRACFMIIGPMPSPGKIPTTIFSFLLKSVGTLEAFIFSILFDSFAMRLPNFSFAKLIFCSKIALIIILLTVSLSNVTVRR